MRSGLGDVESDVATAEERLNADRFRALELLASLSADWDSIVEGSAQANVDDEHDPEGATLAFERARVEASLSRTRAQLAEIDNALRRIGEGDYGSCEQCGAPIGAERLAARPATRTCIACASA